MNAPEKTSLVAVLAVVALGVSACGGSGDDAKASKSVSDKIMSAQKSGATSLVRVKRKDADCIGDGLVDKVGVTKLQKYKLLDKDLKAQNDITAATMSAADARAATNVFFSCTDMQGLVQKAVGSSGSVSKTMQKCIDQALTDTNLRAFLTLTFEGKSDAAQRKLIDPMTKCAPTS